MPQPENTATVRHDSTGDWWKYYLPAGGLASLLLIAACLTPNPRGRGTHQQLGLPPCTSIVLWNRPCPACGMTTSWAHFMRGDLSASARANPGGLLLAIQSVVSIPCFLLCAHGRRRFVKWFWIGSMSGLSVAMLAAVVHWGLMLV